MPNLVRKIMKIFGSSAGPEEIGVYGSLQAGSPDYSTDPDEIQSLPAWQEGLYGATVGDAPAIEDDNAINYVATYQLAYLLQKGIPGWSNTETYYIGSFASDGEGKIYFSIQDNNTNNPLVDDAWWSEFKAAGITPVAVASTGTCVANTYENVDLSGGISLVRVLPSLPLMGEDPITIFVIDALGLATDAVEIEIQPASGESISTYAVDDSVSINVAKANFGFMAYPGAPSWTLIYEPLTIPQGGQLPASGGSAIGSAFLGHCAESLGVSASLSSTDYSVTSNAGIELSEGNYDLQAVGQISPAVTTTLRSIILFLSTSNGNNTTGIDFNRNVFSSYHGNITNANGDSWRVSTPVYRVVVPPGVTVRYYPKLRVDFGTSTCQGVANLFVRKY